LIRSEDCSLTVRAVDATNRTIQPVAARADAAKLGLKMAERFEKGSLEHSLGLSEIYGALGVQMERIQNALEEFLPLEEAQETAIQVYNLALDIDQNIDRILKDPLVRRLYEYDGEFFTPRGTPGFHVAFDGLHLLRSLSDSKIGAFFRGTEEHFAIRWLLKELSTHAWVAKRLRMNWEESHTLGLVSKEVLGAIFKDALERRSAAAAGPPELSLEERIFFQSYEAQMEEQG
jgi:hypothetical protein